MNLFELFAKISLDTGEYTAGLEKASGLTQSIGGKIGGALGTAAKVGAAALGAASAATAAFAADAVSVGMQFDTSMSQVAATMGYSVAELNEEGSEAAETFTRLRDFAQEMGASTAFSASQSADALNYMALAGYDADTAISMLPNVLNLAAAGSMELASASDMITDSQSALGLTLEETADLVDKMATASSKSNTSVEQLGSAILTVGGTAKNLSGGTTELATALGILADNGVKGAEGGTALRNIILAMTPTSDKAAAAFQNLGVSAYDAATGELRPLADIFADLKAGLDDLTDREKQEALTSIFNKVDLKSVNALLSATEASYATIAKTIETSGVNFEKYKGASWLSEALKDDPETAMREYLTRLNKEMGWGVEQIHDALITGLKIEEKDADALTEALTLALQEEERLGENAPADRFHELAGYIDDATGAAQAMADTQLDNLAGDLTIFQSALEGAKIALSNELTPALRDFVSLGTQGLSVLAIAIKEDGLGGAMEALGPFIDNAIGMLMEGLPKVIAFGGQLLIAIVTGLIDNLPKLADGVVQLAEALGKQLRDNGPAIMEKGGELLGFIVNGIIDAVPKLLDGAAGIISGLGTYLKEKLPDLIPAAVEAIVKLGDYLTDPSTLVSLVNAAGDIIIGLIQGLENAIPKLLLKAPEWIGKLAVALIAAIPKILEVGLQIVGGLLTGIAEGFVGLLTAIPAFIKGLIDGFKDLLGIHSPSTVFADIGKNIVEGLKNGIANVWKTVTRFFTDKIEAIKNKFTQLGSSLKTIGGNIVTGLRNGISAAWDGAKGLAGWFSGKVGGLITAAKEKLGVASPSKVFASIGGFMAEGLGEGWENEYRTIRQQIQDGLDFSADFPDVPVSVTPSSVGANGGAGSTAAGRGYTDTTDRPIVVQVVLDGKILGETVTRYQSNTRRAYGTA